MSQNLILGRGKAYFDLYAPGTQNTTGRRYLGNSPELAIDIATTQLDHYSSDQGLKIKDDSVILQLDRKGTFKTDEISNENMQLFLIGTFQTQTQTSGTASTSTMLAAKLDRYYQIGVTTGNPSGVRNISAVVVKDDAVTPHTYVLNTDYTVDLTLGLLYIVPTAGSFVDGTTNIVVTYNTAATTRQQVQTTAIAAIDGAFSFISYNPKGVQRDYYMPYVRMTPNGAFALKGDVWQEISFNLEILLKDPSMSHIYVDGRPLT